MRIRQIEVKKLFGVFDHIIPLNMEEGVTILYGLNGFGKTTILRMIKAIFSGSLLPLFGIPFETLTISFDNHQTLVLSKHDIILMHKSEPSTGVKFSLQAGEERVEWTAFQDTLHRQGDLVIQRSGVDFRSKDARRRQIETERLLDIIIANGANAEHLPEWLDQLRASINVTILETERLQALDPSAIRAEERIVYDQAVTMLSDKLSSLLYQTLSEYAIAAQTLDRSFPIRLVKHAKEDNRSAEEIQKKISDLETRRQQLIGLGLLESEAFPPLASSVTIDEASLPVLSVYVQDMEAKFKVFDDIQARLELLVNQVRARFRNKRLVISRHEGFHFVTDAGERLPLTALSSGEQHELVILFTLLFNIKAGTLILIDEPELSLHVAWQVQFVKDMLDIVSLNHFDILMATHSPQIIHDRWDLALELKGP